VKAFIHAGFWAFAFDQPFALACVAADYRRAADAGALLVAGAVTLEICVADRIAAQLRQHRRIAAAARRRPSRSDLLRHRVAVGQNQPAAVEPDARDIFQRDDHGHGVRQPLAVEPSGTASMGKLLALSLVTTLAACCCFSRR